VYASVSIWLYAHVFVCVCAKVLVSYRRSFKRGSDLEEGAGPPADKLLGKNPTAYFQLHLVPEEPVYGAVQLLTGSGKFRATVYYL